MGVLILKMMTNSALSAALWQSIVDYVLLFLTSGKSPSARATVPQATSAVSIVDKNKWTYETGDNAYANKWEIKEKKIIFNRKFKHFEKHKPHL